MSRTDEPRLTPGAPHPLGASPDGRGVNFALFSEGAERVELCLFDGPDAPEERFRIALPERTHGVWHGRVEGLRPGQVYGYRVHGPYDPPAGLLYNPAKVVLDPCARVLARAPVWHDTLFGHRRDGSGRLVRDERDDAPFAPLAAVVEGAFDWGEDRPPATPWGRTVIYEAQVKGFTKRHPGVPEPRRGTFAGLASEAAVKHLSDLGVTAVELLPVHQQAVEPHLAERKLVNYWGYNPLAFFAPDLRFCADPSPEGALREFRGAVKALHAAGIEVLLDVVYNHTGEGGPFGPTLSLRGIDNAAYYRFVPGDPSRYEDFTGCGNTLNILHPQVLRLVLESLRWWAVEMRVDGFRFDLATVLLREPSAVNAGGSFLKAVFQDPVLSRLKLIAEPWDLGPGGYQPGVFLPPWAEWNGRYRDGVRRFWRGDPGVAPEFATRLSGSGDLFGLSGRGPTASVNFVTCHDGFTLADLVAYNEKRNEANLEGNRDGESHNLSWNCGVEGPTEDPGILALRARQRRNLLATLLLSQGVPMILGGDEIGRTQGGNNNAYCQDNAVSWHDWGRAEEEKPFLAFCRRMTRLFRDQPVLRRRTFLKGGPAPDVLWLSPQATEMDEAAWAADPRCFGMLLPGTGSDERDEEGNPIPGETLLILFNAGEGGVPFALPQSKGGAAWEKVVDTADPEAAPLRLPAGAPFEAPPRSLAVFREAGGDSAG